VVCDGERGVRAGSLVPVDRVPEPRDRRSLGADPLAFVDARPTRIPEAVDRA
jgi:hypothetical protein